MHDIITFCNNYINNDNIVIAIIKYPTFISVSFDIWTLSDKRYINKHIGNTTRNIHNKEEFIKFKQKILEELPKLLEQLK